MKEVQKIIFYLIGTLVLGALLAPPLYWAGQWLADAKISSFFEQFEFQKFFNRSVLIAALLLLWPTAKSLRIQSWEMLGIERDRKKISNLGIGFFLALASMVILGIILLRLEIYRMKSEAPWGAIFKILGSAIVVSILEEFLFRGVILGLCRRAMSSFAAILFTSSLFSIVHFLKPREDAIPSQAVTWFSGFQLIPEAFWQFGEPMLLLAGFTTLFCVGWVLAYVTLKTRSLWMAVGLHAGWILGTMGFSKLTKRLEKDTLPWLGDNLEAGLASVTMVILTGLILWWYLRNETSSRSLQKHD